MAAVAKRQVNTPEFRTARDFGSMRTIACLLLIVAVGTGAPAGLAETPSVQEIERVTQLQIFLDNANFGPGKIDGRNGEFTRKALGYFKGSKGEANAQANDPSAKLETTGLDLSEVTPVFTTYTISAQDVASVGELPGEPAAQAKVKRLPYASLAEAIAEKFHCDLKFFKELNPDIADKLKEGDEVKVPNVKPFDLAAVSDLKPGAEAQAVIANELGGDAPTPERSAEADSKSSNSAPDLSVHVSVKDEMLEVHAGQKVVAAFPVTVGSQQTASPIGEWKVKGVAKMPNFRYDKKMLNEGERSSDFHMLPPGPNNPVGVVWIALNKPGIGLHGTNDPDSIGRSASHGCIRLANWDIVKLAGFLKAGVPVKVE